jgi:glycosyltransferase involved in cell wall biosynthesis
MANKREPEPLLSVVMPVFNERATVLKSIAAVRASRVQPAELIVVDDCSTDGTREALVEALKGVPNVTLILHEHNRGKGAALRTGFASARGRFVLIQDADNEYDPVDYPVLLKPLLDGHADVVFGSRFLGGPHRVLYYWHSIANSMLTRISNMITDLNLTDMETCYKVFRREVLEQLDLREDRFGIEPEITAKVAQLGVRVYEVPITYNGRTYAEGKKIGIKDAFRAVYCIVRYGVAARLDRRTPAITTAAAPHRETVSAPRIEN